MAQTQQIHILFQKYNIKLYNRRKTQDIHILFINTISNYITEIYLNILLFIRNTGHPYFIYKYNIKLHNRNIFKYFMAMYFYMNELILSIKVKSLSKM